MKYLTLLLFPCLFLLTSCGDDDVSLEDDIKKIETYLTENNINAQATDSGLHYIIDEEGTGALLTLENAATVNYKGYYLDGEVFDETILYPASFVIANLIEGWREGLQFFRLGSKGRLFIPSKLGYGSNTPAGIRKDAVLVFEIDVIADLAAREQERIQTYLAENGLEAQPTASGLHYIIEEEGDGPHPSAESEVTVNYKGYFLNGDVFDETTGTPATFPLNGVIEGWKEGIPLFKKGGSGKLFVPSGLAYGNTPPQGLPQNAILIFEVELIDF